MSRLIDSDKLIAAINERRCADCPDKEHSHGCAACQWDDAIRMIKSAPTIGSSSGDWISMEDKTPTNKRKMSKEELDFFDWLACAAVLQDDWETNTDFYREVICRKLVRLGLLEIKNNYYVLPGAEMEEDDVTTD